MKKKRKKSGTTRNVDPQNPSKTAGHTPSKTLSKAQTKSESTSDSKNPEAAASRAGSASSSMVGMAISTRTFYLVLSAIVILGFCVKLVRLNQPKDFYFDEVYHAYTAVAYHQGNPEAYNPWTKNPEGVAMEWSHPPFSKLLMAGMISIFGENSIGWRMGSVVFGAIAVVLIAFFALELFGSRFVALLSAFFFSIEGLAFVQSRIAMNDIYLVVFRPRAR